MNTLHFLLRLAVEHQVDLQLAKSLAFLPRRRDRFVVGGGSVHGGKLSNKTINKRVDIEIYGDKRRRGVMFLYHIRII